MPIANLESSSLYITSDLDTAPGRIEGLQHYVESAISTVQENFPDLVPQVVIAYDSRAEHLQPKMHELQTKLGRSHFTAEYLGVTNLSSGYPYVAGLDLAVKAKARIVLQLDTGGAFETRDIPKVVRPVYEAVKRNPLAKVAVMPTRLQVKGGVNTYPLSRQITSRAMNMVARVGFLPREYWWLSDTSSGMQCFSGPLVAEMLRHRPPKKWVTSEYGPFYLMQTEAAILAAQYAEKIVEVGVRYGKNVQGYRLAAQYYPQVLNGLVHLLLLRIQGK